MQQSLYAVTLWLGKGDRQMDSMVADMGNTLIDGRHMQEVHCNLRSLVSEGE